MPVTDEVLAKRTAVDTSRTVAIARGRCGAYIEFDDLISSSEETTSVLPTLLLPVLGRVDEFRPVTFSGWVRRGG